MDIILTTPEQIEEIFTKCLANHFKSTPPPIQEKPVEQPISQPDAIKFLGKSRQTLIKWRKAGNIKAYTLGGRVYYLKSELLSALQNFR
jgi:hypothetical protein